MRNIISFLIFMFLSLGVSADQPSLDEETKALCNQVMMNIYQDILEAKDTYKELGNFDQGAVTSNVNGIYSIHYQYTELEGAMKGVSYEFGLTIVGLDEPNTFPSDSPVINLGFPLLNLKFIGYQKKTFKKGQFDIQIPLAKYGQILWNHQQKYMPYQLSLESVKEEFKINEPIEFTVTLKNLTNKNILVKDLGGKTLFFLYDNKVGGAAEIGQAAKDVKDIVLKSQEFIVKRFRIKGIPHPKELEIYCSYILTFQEVKPSASLKIKVVK